MAEVSKCKLGWGLADDGYAAQPSILQCLTSCSYPSNQWQCPLWQSILNNTYKQHTKNSSTHPRRSRPKHPPTNASSPEKKKKRTSTPSEQEAGFQNRPKVLSGQGQLPYIYINNKPGHTGGQYTHTGNIHQSDTTNFSPEEPQQNDNLEAIPDPR